MDLETARKIVGDAALPMMERIEAASTLSLSPDATLDELVACLRFRGVIAELAAMGLFRRTGRPKPRRLRDFTNIDQWEQYLIRQRLAESPPPPG
jgi:hypothetical protein